MQQKKEQKGQIMGTLFTMLLFLVFVMCALFTVLAGGKVYENIGSRMADNYTKSVALQYIANKIRQGDEAGMARVLEVEGTSVLELRQEFDSGQYVSWIYYYDGSIRELFTRKDSGLGLPDGIPILECEGLSFTQEGQLLTVETSGDRGGRLLLSLRSAGGME
ncbi:MAG: DUF4860 domain-containing protein [Lachnospiraceae bacterium]|nr:DUF4860 domain-containing protein [Lachnospiraceae bacterium]